MSQTVHGPKILSANGLHCNRKEMWGYEVPLLHNISTCHFIPKGWSQDTYLYYTSSENVKTLHMILMVLVFQLMKLHPFHVFLMSEAHSEGSPCWTKPHGTLHALETLVPSAVQPNSNRFQDVIQITHSGQPVAEFLQKISFDSVNISSLIL